MLALSLWRTTKAAHIRVDEKKINTNTMLQKRCLQNMMNPQMFLQLFYIYLIFFNGGCWERNWTRTSGKEYPRIIPKTNPLWTNRHVGFPFCCPGLVPLEWRRDHFFHFLQTINSLLKCLWWEAFYDVFGERNGNIFPIRSSCLPACFGCIKSYLVTEQWKNLSQGLLSYSVFFSHVQILELKISID